jgi:hypothetical protein
MVELVKTPTPIQAGDAALVNRGGVPEMVVLGTAATADTNIFATSVQGSTADSAVQPGDLSSVAFSGSYADLINIPTTFTPSAHTHTVSEITDFPVLAIVATSGSYNDLLNLPALFDGAYSSLSGIPTTFAPSAHTHTVSEITDFPVLATVATSGSYNDLLNLPVLFDGSYTSLTNIPATFTPSAHTHTVSEINDLTATAAELNILDGVTVTAAQINQVADINTKVPRTSTTGAAVIPTGTEAQRDVAPLAGYFRFNSDVAKFEGYNGTAWGAVGGGATGGGGDEVFVQNGQTVTTSYTIPADKNAMSTGPITINAGVVVTVSAGARYVVI